jgi:hypothetical protein
MLFGMVDFVRFELLPLIPEDAIEVYHERLYYEHYLVKMGEEGRLRIADFIKNEKTNVHSMDAKHRA